MITNDVPFMMYILEQEGELDTYQGKKNRIIKNLRQRPWEEQDETAVHEEALAAGLYNLTDQEVEEILREVNM
jgi:hypothetical protein